jgi:intracellular sulfur oxidation DsrE/DsrF family protein
MVLLNVYAGNLAAKNSFTDGPLITGYGKHAKVEQSHALDKNTKLNVAFDVSERTGDKLLNRKFDSLARFLNMHVANGIPAKNIKLALVVHGKAGLDLLSHETYKKMANRDNPNGVLLDQLMANQVKVYMCGQSAAYMEIASSDLYAGVQMPLSSMTAHALLQKEGYSLNPFDFETQVNMYIL